MSLNDVNRLAGSLYNWYHLDTSGLEAEREVFRGLHRAQQDLSNKIIYFYGGYCGQPGVGGLRNALENFEKQLGKHSFEYLQDQLRSNDLGTATKKIDHLRQIFLSVEKELYRARGFDWQPDLSLVQPSNIHHKEESVCASFLGLFGFRSQEATLDSNISNSVNELNQEIQKFMPNPKKDQINRNSV